MNKLHEGRPHIVDRIKNGEIDLILNTPYGKQQRYDDSYIRSTAVSAGIPCITTLAGTRAAVSALTALSNVGPGLGEIIGPSGNFGPLEDSAKWVLAFMMLLGRLELFTMLVMLSPAFWRE